jgi:hypothetical protein
MNEGMERIKEQLKFAIIQLAGVPGLIIAK